MAVRSAEAERLSSCSFADRVAGLSIKFFRSKCSSELLEAYKQTVIATIVVQIPNDTPILQNEEKDSSFRTTLKVVSLGVGTKVLNADQIVADKSINAYGGKLIRDCHAEILARRGFLAYLYSELESLSETPQSQSGEAHTISHQHNKQQHSIFEYNPIGKKLQLKRGVTLHIYTSSQPCGNASIKRWAKSKAPPQDTSLSPDEYPVETHTKIQITEMNRNAGQVAVLVKKNKQNSAAVLGATVGTSTETTPTGPYTTTLVNSSLGNISSSGSNNPASHKVKNNSTRNTTQYDCMPGTASTDSGMGNVMACSDKIAKWNALGLQGSLLSHFYEPLFLSTITIGRKFSKIHAERALCCRLQDFCYPVTAGAGAGGGHKKISGKLSNKRGRYEAAIAMTDNNTNINSNVLNEASTTSQTNSRSDEPNCTVTQTIVGGTVYRIHHPVMLGTKIKFDESSIVTGAATIISNPLVAAGATVAVKSSREQVVLTTAAVEETGISSTAAAAAVVNVGAQFSDWRSLCCWVEVSSISSECFARYITEVIDGHTGLLCSTLRAKTVGATDTDYINEEMSQQPFGSEGSTVSMLSSACFGERFRTLMTRMVESSVEVVSNSSGWSELSYVECKKWVSGLPSQTSYGAAKSCLMSDDKLFGEWIVK